MAKMNMTATENREQATLLSWATMQTGKYPELSLLFHIPNGGHRNAAEAARFKAEGVKAGVPDLFLPVARQGKHGLWIEMKRREGGRVSEHQSEWIEQLREQGYAVEVCCGWEEASALLVTYLGGEYKASEFKAVKKCRKAGFDFDAYLAGD